MKEKKKILIAAVILVLACIIGWFAYQKFAPIGEEGAKTVTVKVIHADKKEKDFKYRTDAAYLGDVLKDNKLVEGEVGEYGLFITSADGEKADESKQQWWCITKGKEKVNSSADKTPVEDGDTFELTLTEGY